MSRVEQIRRILEQETPYRVNLRLVRSVCNVLPQPRRAMRLPMVRVIAAVVALPYELAGRIRRAPPTTETPT